MNKLVALFFVVIFSLHEKAQDPFFLNSNQSLVYLNPSFAGSNGGFRNQFSYRNQWPNLSARIFTYLNSADVYLSPIKAGIGVQVLYDDVLSGTYNSSLYSFSYAQHLQFYNGQLKLIPSLQLSYGHRKIDASQMNFRTEISDPRYGYSWTPTGPGPVYEKTYVDVSAGFLINYKEKLYAGASFFHLNQPDIGFTQTRMLPNSLNLHTSYNLEFSNVIRLQLFYLMKVQQDYYSHRLAINVLGFDHLITGIACINFDSPVLNAGYRNNYFSVLLGYDFTMSKLAGNTAGSWELHASINLRNEEVRKSVTSFESW